MVKCESTSAQQCVAEYTARSPYVYSQLLRKHSSWLQSREFDGVDQDEDSSEWREILRV